MIVKSFETNKINFNNSNLLLLYGKNEGLKSCVVKGIIKDKNNIYSYDEKDVLDNLNFFFETILSKSLFEKEKIIIIKRATDKIIKIIEEIYSKNLEEIFIIINADTLEKKSKLRSFFEKNKKCICVAFYPDTDQTLSKLTYNYLKDQKITISQADINLITSRSNGDRETLINELKKIEYFCLNGKKINTEILSKLTNLSENHSIAELVDNCLAKNKKKTINILSENNFSNEDCILITKSFIIKAKKLLALSETFETNKNIDLTISSAKPPIFWKEKEITKNQILKWKPKNIKNLIYALSETELQIKKNINNSINLITDFILFQSSSVTNN